METTYHVVWVVGDNIPGYLPDTDPHPATDPEHAKQCLIETLERDNQALEPEETEKIADIGSVIGGLKQQTTGEFSITVNDRAYWVSKDAMSAEDLRACDCDPEEYEKV